MRDRAIVVACVLVVGTNLGALGRAALNRSSVDSGTVLTERELRPVQSAASVTQLGIQWMQPSPDTFDAAQLERAGFETSVDPAAPHADLYYRRQLQRDVYVALEYDGPSWIAFRDHLLTDSHDVPSSPEPAHQAERQTALTERIEGHTRLFAVAIDGDARRLRAAFPDRAQYLIARARVSVSVHTDAQRRRRVAARIRELMPGRVNVPRPFSSTLRELTQGTTGGPPDGRALPVPARIATGWPPPRFVAELKYGRFQEPWISDLRPFRR
jgi:hypothetical protein